MINTILASARWTAAAVPVLAGVLLLAACDEKSTEPVRTPVHRIEVSADRISIAENATTQVSARLMDVRGGELKREVSWSSSDAEIATVDANGKVTGLRGGVVRITATAGEAIGSVGITVQEHVRTIELSPALPELGLAASVPLEATLRCANGHVMTRPITWSSSDPAVLGVSATGRVTAISPGTAQVIVAAAGVTVELPVTVVSPWHP